ncbi:sensor histidine kinase [Pedobacter hartonius]|uniref:Histidine kinase n=1 Tax=Pedobacter hartonius TaxID=425514 RepID=A0A1H4GZ98_9SPHI|nr:histidine kinase [Pedobacter hartonius]SEB14826.1 Histidine kinase [Pedobacter hartonius]
MKRLSRLISNKYVIYAIHVLFWMLLIFPFLSGPYHPAYFEQLKYRIIFNNSILIILFYFNAYYLYPKVFRTRGWPAYIFSVMLSVGLLVYVSFYVEKKWMPVDEFTRFQWHHHRRSNRDFPPPMGPPRGGFPFAMYLFIIGISFSYRLMTDQNIEEKKRKEQETETLKTELDFLRSQISPHFMFNVLNTLVAMARKKSDLIEPSLIQLSTLMRYVLHESNYSRIPLGKEVEYLKNYIELQSLRFGDDLNLIMEIAENTEGFEIEPMLLIPFVENAFKHGLGTGDEARLLIRLSIDNALSVLHFTVENEIAPLNNSKDASSGIGLKNVSRRLELLYKDRYTLNTMVNDNIFIADLTIELR